MSDEVDYGFGSELPEVKAKGYTRAQIAALESAAQEILASHPEMSISDARKRALELNQKASQALINSARRVSERSRSPLSRTWEIIADLVDDYEVPPELFAPSNGNFSSEEELEDFRLLSDPAHPSPVKSGFTNEDELKAIIFMLVERLGGKVEFTADELSNIEHLARSTGIGYALKPGTSDNFGVTLETRHLRHSMHNRITPNPSPSTPATPSTEDDDGVTLPF